jgi:hypothetical protein
MNLFEAIIMVEQMRRRKVTLAGAERGGTYSKQIGVQHQEEADALELVLAAARGVARGGAAS